MSGFTKPARPAHPRRFARFGKVPGQNQQQQQGYQFPESERDEFGLLRTIYGKAPAISRQYIARALEYLRLPKDVNPMVLFGPSQGTIPELVVFGGLLARGYIYQYQGPRGFFFQTNELGGRQQAGGAVVDFEVITGIRHIGVDVDSIYHTIDNPFHAAAKVESDKVRRIKLLSAGRLDNAISVNQREKGYCLEWGPEHLVLQDFDRIENA